MSSDIRITYAVKKNIYGTTIYNGTDLLLNLMVLIRAYLNRY